MKQNHPKSRKHGGKRPGAGAKKGGYRRPYRNPDLWCIYVLHEAGDTSVCKIGITSYSWSARMAALQTGNWRKLVGAGHFDLDSQEDASILEGRVHNLLEQKRVNGEWFQIEAKTAFAIIAAAMVEMQVQKMPEQKTLL